MSNFSTGSGASDGFRPLTPRELEQKAIYEKTYGPIPGADIDPEMVREAILDYRDLRNGKRRAYSRPATTYTEERTLWLWEKHGGRIPLGELTILAGKGGVGKSTIFAMWAAWLTRGTMEGEFYGTPRNIIYVVNEDSISKTVLPRMLAAGADINRVFFLEVETEKGADALRLPEDSERLRDAVDWNDAAAVFVDPFSSNIEAQNRNDQGEMRRAFQSVRAIAEEAQIAILGLAHFKKENVSNAVDAIMGSSEQGNVVRAVLSAVRDEEEDGKFLLSQEKNNLGKTDFPGWYYTIESAVTPAGNPTSKIKLGQQSDESGSDKMQEAVTGQSKSSAIEWLPAYLLENGPTMWPTIKDAAKKDLGVSEATLKRARTALNKRKNGPKVLTKRGFGTASTWYLEEQEANG